MATIGITRVYRCDNDCLISGCPGHELNVTISTVTDTMFVTVDGEDLFFSDTGKWNALRQAVEDLHYEPFSHSS